MEICNSNSYQKSLKIGLYRNFDTHCTAKKKALTNAVNPIKPMKHITVNHPNINFDIFYKTNGTSLSGERNSFRIVRILSTSLGVLEEDVIAVEFIEDEANKQALLYLSDSAYKNYFKKFKNNKVMQFFNKKNRGIFSYSLLNDYAISELHKFIDQFDYAYMVNSKELKVKDTIAIAVEKLNKNHHLNNVCIYSGLEIKKIYQNQYNNDADLKDIKTEVFFKRTFNTPLTYRKNLKIERFGGYSYLNQQYTQRNRKTDFACEHKYAVFTASHKNDLRLMIIDMEELGKRDNRNTLDCNYNGIVKYSTTNIIDIIKVLNYFNVACDDRIVGNGTFMLWCNS